MHFPFITVCLLSFAVYVLFLSVGDIFEAIVSEKEEKKLWEKLLKNINMETDKILWIPITEDEERGSIHYGRNCFSLEESENFVCI